MNTPEQEGVIQYRLDYQPGTAPSDDLVEQLEPQRRRLVKTALLGRDPQRYGGYAYGNISLRHPQHSRQFIITGTQISDLPELGPEGYTTVLECDPAQNHLVSEGPCRPSSEAMTHAALYLGSADIGAIVHGHCPVIRQAAERLGIPITDPQISYGTPQMAQAVFDALALDSEQPSDVLVMGGHEDGFIAVGADITSATEAALALHASSARLIEIQ